MTDRITRLSSPAEKIALFRNLFSGRTDVYPKRHESRTGASGYTPTCANEWVPGLCAKPKTKCPFCPSRKFLSMTDDVIRCHLCGHDDHGKSFTAGVYAMLPDETCRFPAIDFDREDWRDEVAAFRSVCLRRNIPVAIERSRSGNGGHAWFFFAEAIPATLARQLPSHRDDDGMPGSRFRFV